MTKKQIIIIGIIVLIFPLFLNYFLQCPSPFVNIIGEEQAPSKWLDFWASYGGALVSSSISLYILYSTLEQNKNENDENRKLIEKNRIEDNKRFEYIQRKKELDDLIQLFIIYIGMFSNNILVEVYNKWLYGNKKEEREQLIKNLYDDIFHVFEKISFYFPTKDFKTDTFLINLSNDYKERLSLYDDVQALINCDNRFWNNKFEIIRKIESNIDINKKISAKFKNVLLDKNIKNDDIFTELLSQYDNISQKVVESRIRSFIDYRKSEIEKILK